MLWLETYVLTIIYILIVILIFLKSFRIPIRRNSRMHIKWLIYRIKVNQIFKNLYGPVEILWLHYQYIQEIICMLWLLQGDPNVPASEISLFGDLTSPLVLTAEQQENLDSLTAVPEHHAMEQSGTTVRQPFRIPEHFSDRDNRYIPEFCTFRYDLHVHVYEYMYLKRIKPYVFERVSFVCILNIILSNYCRLTFDHFRIESR